VHKKAPKARFTAGSANALTARLAKLVACKCWREVKKELKQTERQGACTLPPQELKAVGLVLALKKLATSWLEPLGLDSPGVFNTLVLTTLVLCVLL